MTAAEAPGGPGGLAARIAAGDLADVPPEALRAGLRLPLHDHLGLELTALRPVVVELPLTERCRSLDAPLHGGALATLVDVAANVAAATGGVVDVSRYGLVTVRAEIDFRSQPVGSLVRCTATVTGVERRAVRTDCTVTDDRGRLVGRAAVTSRPVPRRAALPVDGAR